MYEIQMYEDTKVGIEAEQLVETTLRFFTHQDKNRIR